MMRLQDAVPYIRRRIKTGVVGHALAVLPMTRYYDAEAPADLYTILQSRRASGQPHHDYATPLDITHLPKLFHMDSCCIGV